MIGLPCIKKVTGVLVDVHDRLMTLSKRTISAQVFAEYLETVAQAQQFQVSNLRNWDLLRCYAELQFRLNGGARCSMCRACVRHVIPVTVERVDGTTEAYDCLCTRCFEGERARNRKIIQQVGEARVEQTPREQSKKTTSFRAIREKAKAG
jgi:hypothetical protein